MRRMEEKIEKWKRLTMLLKDAEKRRDDHAKCPECKDQILFCSCVAWLAQEILEEQIWPDEFEEG